VPEFLTGKSARILFESYDSWSWKRERRGPLWWAFKASLTTRLWEEMRLPEYLRHRAAMGGLEARPPLIDVRLVDLALSVPPEFDFNPRHDRPVMREGLKGRVPDEVRLWRKKSNLAPLFHNAVLADLGFISRVLLTDDAQVREFVRTDAVRGLLATPPRVGERGWMSWPTWVWSLVNVECWLRQQADPSFARRMLESGDLRPPASRVVRTSHPAVAWSA
jgi:hypothetical protein